MKNRATMTLGNQLLVAEMNEFAEAQVDWSIWPKNPRVSSDCPIAFGSFFIERYMDKTWLPHEELFDDATRSIWKRLRHLCYKLGMRKNKH